MSIWDWISEAAFVIGFVVIALAIGIVISLAIAWLRARLERRSIRKARNKADADKIANQLAELNILADIAKARLASLEPRTQTLERQMLTALSRSARLEPLPKKTNPRKDICPPRTAPKSKKP